MGVYVPRSPTTGVLYGVVRGHWSDFAAEVRDRTDGVGLPAFVVGEFRKFLRCGVLAHGFARVRCADCAFERLVPFSLKGRGFCPSCSGRRMAERATHLVEHVFPPDVPVTPVGALGAPSPALPTRLRSSPVSDGARCLRTRAALRVSSPSQTGGARRRRNGHGDERQRFGGALNLHVHFHTLVLDGVFVRQADDTLVFHPVAPPTDADVHRVVRRVHRAPGATGARRCACRRRGRRSFPCARSV